MGFWRLQHFFKFVFFDDFSGLQYCFGVGTISSATLGVSRDSDVEDMQTLFDNEFRLLSKSIISCSRMSSWSCSILILSHGFQPPKYLCGSNFFLVPLPRILCVWWKSLLSSWLGSIQRLCFLLIRFCILLFISIFTTIEGVLGFWGFGDRKAHVWTPVT